MPDKAIYMLIARELETTPWEVEKNMTLDWYQFIMTWMAEKPTK